MIWKGFFVWGWVIIGRGKKWADGGGLFWGVGYCSQSVDDTSYEEATQALGEVGRDEEVEGDTTRTVVGGDVVDATRTVGAGGRGAASPSDLVEEGEREQWESDAALMALRARRREAMMASCAESEIDVWQRISSSRMNSTQLPAGGQGLEMGEDPDPPRRADHPPDATPALVPAALRHLLATNPLLSELSEQHCPDSPYTRLRNMFVQSADLNRALRLFLWSIQQLSSSAKLAYGDRGSIFKCAGRVLRVNIVC